MCCRSLVCRPTSCAWPVENARSPARPACQPAGFANLCLHGTHPGPHLFRAHLPILRTCNKTSTARPRLTSEHGLQADLQGCSARTLQPAPTGTRTLGGSCSFSSYFTESTQCSCCFLCLFTVLFILCRSRFYDLHSVLVSTLHLRTPPVTSVQEVPSDLLCREHASDNNCCLARRLLCRSPSRALHDEANRSRA